MIHCFDYMPVSLTPRDAEIIDALTHRVRVLSLEQVGRTWWTDSFAPKQQSAARLKILSQEGLVSSYTALAHPELPLDEPVVQWAPGEPEPDFSSASYRLQNRWTEPFIPVTCFMATKRAGRVFGGCGGRRSRTSEQTHDIHLTAVFLRYRRVTPHLVSKWASEAAILRERTDRREKLPDAIIDDGEQRKIVEFGGSYGRDKISSFHEYCEAQALPYEVW